MKTFESRAEWEMHCRAAGFEGPYRLHSPAGYQFIGKSGTAAMWHEGKAKGYVFRDDPVLPTLEGTG